MNRRIRSIFGTASILFLSVSCGAFLSFPLDASGDTARIVALSIRHHTFIPDAMTVPAHRPFTIHVTNNDNHPEEFESYDLEFEIIILPHRSIDVPIRPLPPGSYEFFGDFHPRTARGHIHVVQ